MTIARHGIVTDADKRNGMGSAEISDCSGGNKKAECA